MKHLKKTETRPPKAPRHSTHRTLRGSDRRAIRREWREAQAIILHPSLFAQTLEVA